MIISRSASSHYIPAGMFLLVENALGNPNLVQSSVPVNCYVTIVDPDNVPLTELEEWPSFRLISKDIQLTHGDGECFVYISVPRTAIGNAEVVYPPVEIDRFGKKSDGTQLGSTDFFYYQLGTVSAIIDGQRTIRVDMGALPPVNNLPVGLSALEHMIEIEKGSPNDISQWVLSILSRTKVNKLEAEQIAFSVQPEISISQWIPSGSTVIPTDNAVFTAAYIKDYFLSRKEDDTAKGVINFEKGIRFGNLLLSLEGDNTLYLTNILTGERANFAASGAIATKGIGSSSGGGGVVPWSEIENSIIPKVTDTYSIGTNTNKWKSIYAIEGHINSLDTHILSAENIKLNGKEVATKEYVIAMVAQGGGGGTGGSSTVSYLPTIEVGRDIGTLIIDGVSYGLYAPSRYSWDEIDDTPNFSTVAFTGSYNDLADVPTIPSIVGLASEEWVNTQLGDYQKKITSSNKLSYALISGTPTKLSEFTDDVVKGVYQPLITTENKLAYTLISGVPTSLKNPYSLKFGSKSYDGSSQKEITANDLGALTSHQTIYTLTIQKNGKDVGTFTPNSKDATINISDVVTLSEEQTITGRKTFEGKTTHNGGIAIPSGKTLKIGSIVIEEKDGGLFINGDLAASGSVATKGIGSSSGNGGASTLYQLNDVLADGSKVSGALKGNVLMYNGTHWYGEKIEIPEVDLSDYYTQEEVNTLLSYKQGTIDDLTAIRSGAALGATALQPGALNGYATLNDVEATYVKKVSGKGLSTEDFTTALKNKLNSLYNYDDTEISQAIDTLRVDFNTLVGDGAQGAIDTFNEIVSFLEGVEDNTLSGIIAGIEKQIGDTDKSLSETKAHVSALQTKTSGLESGLGQVSTNVSKNTANIAANTTTINTNKANIATNAAAIEALSKYIDKLFTLDEATETIKTKYNFSSEKSIATKGVGSSNGGGGNSYGRLDDWANYNASNGDVLSALLGYGLKSDIATLTSKFGNYFTKNETRNEIVAYLSDFNDEMIVPNYSTKSEVSSLADVVGGIGSRVSTLEGKATAVSFAQTLQSGKQIGVLSIDGTNTTLFAPAGYAWGEITSKPITLEGYGITDALPYKYIGETDLNTVYDAGMYTIMGVASNYPSTRAYGQFIVLPYRKASGNTKPDFAAQLYLPNGDDKSPNMYFRLGNSADWGAWRTVLDSENYSSYALPLRGGTIRSTSNIPLVLDTTNSDSILRLSSNGTHVASIGYETGFGLVIQNFKGNSPYINITDEGEVKIKNTFTLIHSGNIGSQSVNYATSAGNANILNKVYSENINYDAYTSALKLIKYDGDNWEADEFPSKWTSGLSVMAGYNGWQMVTFGGLNPINPYFRKVTDENIWTEWKQIAFLDDNVASANKLSTARTIWGQSFDGSGNVSGNLHLGTSRLMFSDSSTDYLAMYLSNTYGLYIGDGTSSKYNTSIWGDNLRFVTGTNGQIRLCIKNNGNVLIGTTTDSGYKLDVDGNTRTSYMYAKNSVFAGLSNEYGVYLVGGDTHASICVHSKGTWVSSNIALHPDKTVVVNGVLVTTGNILPTSNETYTLGTSSIRWLGMYGVSGNFSGNVAIGGTLKVGSILIEDKDGDLFINGNVAASGSVATKGIGTSGSGEGGTIPWSALENSLIATSTSYNLGSSAKPWGSVYANSGTINRFSVGSAKIGDINGYWSITHAGVASFSSVKVNGYNVATEQSVASSLSNYLLKSGGDIEGDLSLFGDYVRFRNCHVLGLSNSGSTQYWGISNVGAASFQSVKIANETAATQNYVQNNFAANSDARIDSYLTVYSTNRNVTPTIKLETSNDWTWDIRNEPSALSFYCISPSGGASSVMTLGTSGDLSISGRLTQSSDETLKNVLGYNVDMKVRDIANAPVCYFTWKDRVSDRQIGTIAQYWKLITPECVVGEEGRMSMDYSTLGLVSSIINAREIVKHEDEIETLKRRVKELEDKLAAVNAA